jgi:glucokinase
MNKQMMYCLALDIGGSKVAVAQIDPTGTVDGEIRTFPVPFDPSGIADPYRLIGLIRPFVDQARRAGIDLGGFGLSLCGTVNEETGEAVLNSNLHWRNLPFGEMLRKTFDLPVHAATDVRQAALAEHLWGAARGAGDFAWCTIGTGFGGYLYLGGRMYGGIHGFAGNFGHITLDEINGYPCGCGRRGCFETFVAGPAIARHGQAAADSGRSQLLAQLAGGEPVTTRMVIRAEAEGDPAAVEIMNEVIRLISINLGGVVNLLDLKMIVMGGGVVNSTPDFVQRIQTRIRDYLMTEEAKRDLEIVKESYQNSALYGAAADFFIREGILPPETSAAVGEKQCSMG